LNLKRLNLKRLNLKKLNLKKVESKKLSKSIIDKSQRINLSDDETDNFPSILNKIKSSDNKPTNLGYEFKNLDHKTIDNDVSKMKSKNQVLKQPDNNHKQIIKDKEHDDLIRENNK